MASTTLPRRNWTDAIKRWPTALAVGLMALTLGGGESDSMVEAYGEILLLLPLLYLIVAKMQRRRASWPVLIVSTTAFIALQMVGPDLGRYLVAAGWLLHGIWDFVHLWLDKVVVRSYAEWCGVFDVLIAAELVLVV